MSQWFFFFWHCHSSFVIFKTLIQFYITAIHGFELMITSEYKEIKSKSKSHTKLDLDYDHNLGNW